MRCRSRPSQFALSSSMCSSLSALTLRRQVPLNTGKCSHLPLLLCLWDGCQVFWWAYLSVCLFAEPNTTTSPIFYAHCLWLGSVLLQQFCDVFFCFFFYFQFCGYVMFSHNGPVACSVVQSGGRTRMLISQDYSPVRFCSAVKTSKYSLWIAHWGKKLLSTIVLLLTACSSFHFANVFIVNHSNQSIVFSLARWNFCRPSSESIVTVAHALWFKTFPLSLLDMYLLQFYLTTSCILFMLWFNHRCCSECVWTQWKFADVW